jgi:hypothetical protein
VSTPARRPLRDADAHGLDLGRAVGTNAWSKARTYFLGIAG